jgi:hypothetical protein
MQRWRRRQERPGAARVRDAEGGPCCDGSEPPGGVYTALSGRRGPHVATDRGSRVTRKESGKNSLRRSASVFLRLTAPRHGTKAVSAAGEGDLQARTLGNWPRRRGIIDVRGTWSMIRGHDGPILARNELSQRTSRTSGSAGRSGARRSPARRAIPRRLQSASQQQDKQNEQDEPAKTPADSRAAHVEPAAAQHQQKDDQHNE